MSDEKNEEFEFVADEEGVAPDIAKKMKKLRSELTMCESERKEYLDGWQRAKADYVNFKKDEARRFEDLGRFVTTGFVEDLLPVLDSFDLALGHGLPPDLEKGVLLIRSQFEDILKKRGVLQVETRAGEMFDPARHESIGEMESAHPPGSIAEVVQRGYALAGRVLRPARVRLSK